jgi:hypothetical protein
MSSSFNDSIISNACLTISEFVGFVDVSGAMVVVVVVVVLAIDAVVVVGISRTVGIVGV